MRHFRRDEIIFLLADCFEQQLGPYDPWTVRLWLLAFAEVDFDYTTHYAACLYENSNIFRRSDDAAIMHEIQRCVEEHSGKVTSCGPDASRRAVGCIVRREMMARLRSHVTAVYGGRATGEAQVLLQFHLIVCAIFEEDCIRLVGLKRYANFCEACKQNVLPGIPWRFLPWRHTYSDIAEMFREMGNNFCSRCWDNEERGFGYRLTGTDNLATMRELNPTASHFRRVHVLVNLEQLSYEVLNTLENHEFVFEYGGVMYPSFPRQCWKFSEYPGRRAGPRPRPLLRTTFSLEPNEDVLSKTYAILRGWIPATLNHDSSRRATWSHSLQSSCERYTSAQKDHQSILFTADEEATWREAQEQAERDKLEARRLEALARRAAAAEEYNRELLRRQSTSTRKEKLFVDPCASSSSDAG